MTVATERSEVIGDGTTRLGPRDAVIEVGSEGRHATPWEDTCPVACLDLSSLLCCGAAPGRAGVEDCTTVGGGHGVSPCTIDPLGGDPASDIGDHRAEASKVSRVIVQCGECVEVDNEVDGALSRGCCIVVWAVEEIHEDVGPLLIDGSTVGSKGSGGVADEIHDGGGTIGRQIECVEVGGAVRCWLQDDPAVLDGMFQSGGRCVRVHLDAQLAGAERPVHRS